MPAHTKRQHITLPLPHEILESSRLPKTFSWLLNEGVSFTTRSTNQNLPTYCGSSWAHAAVSVLMDRIKIVRMQYLRDADELYNEDGYFPDVSLSTQFLLNCGGEIAGSCKGG